ncbi:unnamed protein product [Urochloa humidicola]
MAHYVALIIVAAFSAAFCGLDSLEAFLASQSQGQKPPSHSPDAAAGAVLLSIVSTFALGFALLVARVRSAGAGAGGAEHGHGFATGRLAAATLAASVALLVVGTVLGL